MNNATAVIGGTGTGKTTFIKERLKHVDVKALHLYDVNNEYTDIINVPFTDLDTFINRASKMRNAVIVCEEATIFFGNRGSNDKLREILVRKRHTKNTVFLVFHSLRAVPRYVMDLLNYVILFKTNDSTSLVESKFTDENLTNTFLRVNEHPDQHYFEVFKTY